MALFGSDDVDRILLEPFLVGRRGDLRGPSQGGEAGGGQSESNRKVELCYLTEGRDRGRLTGAADLVSGPVG